MGIGDSITLVSCLAGLVTALPALLVMMNLIFPRTTGAAALRLHRGMILPFFVGLFPVIFFGVPATILISLGSVFQFFGIIAYLLLFLWAFTGLAALARLLGMRLGDLTNRPENIFLETIAGGFVLTLTIAFPLVGWFVVFPLGVVIGVGATIIVMLNRSVARQFSIPKRDFAETLAEPVSHEYAG